MLKNNLKIAWRILWKNKTFSFINIGGLAIGIASSLLLLSYTAFQLSFDNFHDKKENLYRVDLTHFQNSKLIFQSAENYAGLGPALNKEFPEVIGQARLYNMGYKNNCVFTYNNTFFREQKFLYADPSFLTLFTFPFIEGDPKTALTQPYTAVISESFAKKFFGEQNGMGKFIRMTDDDRNSELCQITGIFKDIPQNSHLKFNVLISYPTLYKRGINRFENAWSYKDFYTYVLLRPGTDPKMLETKFPAFIARHIPEQKATHSENILSLEPIEKTHFSTNLIDEPEPTVNEKAIFFLILISIFIITIAWVNYINLATAGSINRAKEIGIRKVLGSQRSQLIKQFLAESLSLNLISFLLAIILVSVSQPLLDKVFPVDFRLSGFLSSRYGLLFLGFLCMGGFVSGLYPAFVLSSFKPATVLKGKIKNSVRGLNLRKSLVVFQFSLSILLIIGTFTVYQQVHYMLNQNLGIKVNQVMVLDRPGRWDTARRAHSRYVERFKEALKRDPSVEAIGMSDELPGKEIRYPSTYTVRQTGEGNAIPINTTGIDEDYLSVLGFKVLAGRNFSKNFKTDQRALIISKSAVSVLGFKNPEDAVGKQVTSDNNLFTIVGVVNDFHQVSLQKKEEPTAFQFTADSREFEYYLVKVKTSNLNQTIGQIQTTWNDAFKENPFDFTFLDAYFNRQYKNEIQFGLLFGTFSFIAIIIACIGLFALAAFMTEQRRKEIGVRKVLGASLKDLLVLLTKDFVRLVLLANLIAWPLGWLIMNNWLKDFAYRIHISWLVFLLSGLTALLIALSTISFKAFKAALANPVKSLKTE
ncbi:ABC transporter permease [Flavitalea flava]